MQKGILRKKFCANELDVQKKERSFYWQIRKNFTLKYLITVWERSEVK
jgi:hypothetical protein